MSRIQKAQAFRVLHTRETAFIVPNPWDTGTARILAYLGFEALATTRMGYAFSTGRPDGAVERSEMLEHIAAIASSTQLPVTRADSCGKSAGSAIAGISFQATGS